MTGLDDVVQHSSFLGNSAHTLSDQDLGILYGMVGRSDAMAKVYRTVLRIGLTDETALIQGETGTGKEKIAIAIHQIYARGARLPFIAINCAGIPKELLESELFGYEKGAFSGAYAQKPGKFEDADTGTLFLDEIGDMPTDLQAKMLRVLQERVVTRLGGSHNIPISVRVIAATNKNIEAEIQDGRFRADLYYRLNVIPIHVPSLSERTGDVRLLAEHFYREYSRKYGQDPTITQNGYDYLEARTWPGNVRELRNFVVYSLISNDGVTPMDRTYFENLNSDSASRPSVQLQNIEVPPNRSMYDLVGEFERIVIHKALERTGGNRRQAAKLLGISRTILYDFLGKGRKHKIKLRKK